MDTNFNSSKPGADLSDEKMHQIERANLFVGIMQEYHNLDVDACNSLTGFCDKYGLGLIINKNISPKCYLYVPTLVKITERFEDDFNNREPYDYFENPNHNRFLSSEELLEELRFDFYLAKVHEIEKRIQPWVKKVDSLAFTTDEICDFFYMIFSKKVSGVPKLYEGGNLNVMQCLVSFFWDCMSFDTPSKKLQKIEQTFRTAFFLEVQIMEKVFNAPMEDFIFGELSEKSL